MITDEAQKRAKILSFWHRHGLDATKEAFNVSKPTLYRWAGALAKSQGKLDALNKRSTVPKNRRKRVVPEAVAKFIIAEREYDPRLSKDKLAVLLSQDGVAHLSPSTVGRMLSDLKRQGRLPKYLKLSFFARTGNLIERTAKRKVKLRSKGHEGDLVKADTVIRFTDGIKRYLLTGLDCERKFAFAYAYTSHSSKNAAQFLRTFQQIAPFPVTHVQTDNGSEFANHFEVEAADSGLIHFHTYPRCPKMNAEIERFNRTIVEAFVNRNRQLLAYDLEAFNRKLMDWLVWYNTRRPHWSLGLISPLRYICGQLPTLESQKCWTDTSP
jgi:transposase InsO family protein